MDATLRSTVGREAEVPRRRMASDMAGEYTRDGPCFAPPRLPDQQRRERTMAQRTRKSAGTSQRKRRATHPKPPFPPQHQPKPGLEAAMQPRPQYEAPQYRG